MALFLGDLKIADCDCPEKIPLGGTLDFTKHKLSDGSNLISATGWTPTDLSLTGELRSSLGSGNPMVLSDRIEAMAQRGKPIQFTWTSELGPVKSFQATITSWLPVIIDDNRISYTLDLTREQGSTMTASIGVTDQQTHVTKGMKNLASRKAQATAVTSGAIDTALATYSRLPPGTPRAS